MSAATATTTPTQSAEAQAKIQEYTQFLDTVLRPQMKEAKRRLEETEEEIAEYTKLTAAIQQLYPTQGDTNTDASIVMAPQLQVDLGYQTVYCKAQVESLTASTVASKSTEASTSKPSKNNNKLFVHVGLGFHAELEPPEALAFCLQRIDFLKVNQLHPRQKAFTQIYDHYQSSVNILQELEKV